MIETCSPKEILAETNVNVSSSFLYDYSRVSYSNDNVPLSQFRDAISPHQITSKLWMANRMAKIVREYSPVLRLEGDDDARGGFLSLSYFGSWLGVGPRLLTDYVKAPILRLVDMDEGCKGFAYAFSRQGKDSCLYWAEDMASLEVDHPAFNSTICVNTSIEHLTPESYLSWWKKVTDRQNIGGGVRLVCVQGTDMDAEDHHQKFKDGTSSFLRNGMDVLYEGRLDFTDCSRFMLIGRLGWE